MKLLVLAAGYATRLYPLTLETPKPLLPVAGRALVDRLLDRLAPVDAVDRIYLVTNAKFAGRFAEWATARGDVTVIDDGTSDEAGRLGAIGDIAFVIEREGIDDDLMVAAGDNLFSEDLGGFGRYCLERNAPAIAVYDIGDLEEIRKYNSIAVDGDGRITFFEEKPEQPTSTLIGIALYFYPRAALPLVRQYLAEGRNPDQPGRLVEWMYPRVPFYTWRVPGRWFDIGSHETLAEAERVFSETEPG